MKTLPAARLGQDPSIAVLQHDDGTLDDPSGLRVSLLVLFEPVLQRVVHDLLHAGVCRRVHLDSALQQIFDSEVGIVRCELLEDMLDEGRRLEGLARVAARHLKRAPLGLRRGLPRDEPIRHHQGQRLVSPA